MQESSFILHNFLLRFPKRSHPHLPECNALETQFNEPRTTKKVLTGYFMNWRSPKVLSESSGVILRTVNPLFRACNQNVHAIKSRMRRKGQTLDSPEPKDQTVSPAKQLTISDNLPNHHCFR